MDFYGWAEEEVPPPTDDDAPQVLDDPTEDVRPWELTAAEQRIYDAGFMTGYDLQRAEHERQVADLNHEADRLYQAAFSRRDKRR
ncbi:hypothetical protein [Frigoribacterium sp. PhB118]|uniref:hypothetical protein n=1 Tax=Frigoribacterium sp. PhB118 TaxID=2485175 RepID=UPI000F477A1E|nr:hypothetical protein [Frigoribacterium sp. PhB118]ROS48755.1 hypothetical protein EDF21_3207 [Frigoribacterium sp. PhB118]